METVNFLPHSAQTAMLPGRRFSYRPFLGAVCGTPARLKSSPSTSTFFFFLAAAVESLPLRFLVDDDEAVEGPASALASVEGATEAATDDEDEAAAPVSAAVKLTEVESSSLLAAVLVVASVEGVGAGRRFE